jgi:hypothetical protein
MILVATVGYILSNTNLMLRAFSMFFRTMLSVN